MNLLNNDKEVCTQSRSIKTIAIKPIDIERPLPPTQRTGVLQFYQRLPSIFKVKRSKKSSMDSMHIKPPFAIRKKHIRLMVDCRRFSHDLKLGNTLYRLEKANFGYLKQVSVAVGE